MHAQLMLPWLQLAACRTPFRIWTIPALTHSRTCWLLQETLQQMVQQLDICQRALSDFLEEKRSMFPRFYFIGDEDLLEVGARSAVCLL